MASAFHLPDIGEGLVEAVILTWHVAVGDAVGLDAPLVEIETDKAIVDIPSPYPGVVLHHGAPENATIRVGSLLAVVGEEGESWEPGTPAGDDGADSPPIIGTLDAADAEEDARRSRQPVEPKALPSVRRLAADLGVDLSTLTGTGPEGRITEDDVREAADGRPVARRPLTPLRRAISENLTRSWREIPHVTTYGEAGATQLLAARKAAGGPPLEALLIARICPPLGDFPEFNSVLDGETVLEKGFYDIGFAVDTSDGLMVAVIKDADTLAIDELGLEVRRLASAARERTLGPGELRGQTFTISNIGAVGGRYGTPVIPYGTSAILSVGRAEPRPVVRDGDVVSRREFPLSLSYDHRLINGATGRRFLAAVVDALEAES